MAADPPTAEEGSGPAAGPAPLLDLQLTRLTLGAEPVLGEIALQVFRGETLALVGPSGIGKSSLLRVIAGLQAAFDGQCRVAGRTAMIFQEPVLLPWRSARDNIRIPTGAAPDAAEAALAEVGLAGREDAFPGQLSLGQQRRLSLARAFATRPDLLLMDEPFVSLDAGLVEEMMALFVRLRAAHGVTTILVTHVEAEARRLASRIVTLGGSPARITGDVQTGGAGFERSALGTPSPGV